MAEDLGLQGGIALAGALVVSTSKVRVGLGIAPTAARHPAFLAMQAATLAQLYPRRFVLGIGHGMPEWMRSLGIWPTSPLARLEETLVTVRDLLCGAEFDLLGAEMTARRARLHTAPANVPILAGVRGPRSLEVAGRASDGVVLAGFAGPEYIASAREILDRHRLEPARIVASARFALGGADTTTSAARRMHRDLVGNLDALRSILPQRFGADPTVDAELLHAVSNTGRAEDLWSRVHEWHNAGADLVLLDALSPTDLEQMLTGIDCTRGHDPAGQRDRR